MMQMSRAAVWVLLGLLATTPALASKLIEPTLHIEPGGADGPRVALTLDACTGAVDERILTTLVNNDIPATIFVTGRWLRHNADALQVLLAHPDLFELEDHGENHIPAVIGSEQPYGLMPAGTPQAVTAEVRNGAHDVLVVSGRQPVWYRGAAALYSEDAMTLINGMGYRIAGFSLNADLGASLSEKGAAKRFETAIDGDVIIAHINQPTRPAGAGIAEGIVALKSKGFHFVRLEDVNEIGG